LSSKRLKAEEYAESPSVVNRSVEDDLQEFVELLAQVMQAQKGGGGVQPPASFIEAFEQSSLGPRHVRVLMSLALQDAQSVSELARRIGLSLATTSLMVGELSRAGLVERSEDERDRRRTIVRLHREHVKTVQTLFRVRTDPMRRALERMPAHERAAFMEGWRVLAEEVASGGGAAEGAESGR
jgi:DNA-binding MarR family transcriptional regulator